MKKLCLILLIATTSCKKEFSHEIKCGNVVSKTDLGINVHFPAGDTTFYADTTKQIGQQYCPPF